MVKVIVGAAVLVIVSRIEILVSVMVVLVAAAKGQGVTLMS